MRRRHRSGFTLIELLIVVVIIGVLAAIAVPKFSMTKGKSYTAAIRSDLHNVATAQESYFYDHGTYATSTVQLAMRSTNGVTIAIVTANAGGWSATAWHPAASPIECGLFLGTATAVSGATTEGVMGCLNLP